MPQPKVIHHNKRGYIHSGTLEQCKTCFKEKFANGGPAVIGQKTGGKW